MGDDRSGNFMKTGAVGEKIAESYLKRAGYEIIERNFRCKKGEIDLIVKKGNIIVFVEVKTRNTLKYGFPVEAITKEKVRHIKKTAYLYIISSGVLGKTQADGVDFRFDVIEVLKYKNKDYIRYNKNVF